MENILASVPVVFAAGLSFGIVILFAIHDRKSSKSVRSVKTAYTLEGIED